MRILIDADPSDGPHSEEQCSGPSRGQGGGGSGETVYTACCQHDEYFWTHYNFDNHCCDPLEGVKLNGEC